MVRISTPIRILPPAAEDRRWVSRTIPENKLLLRALLWLPARHWILGRCETWRMAPTDRRRKALSRRMRASAGPLQPQPQPRMAAGVEAPGAAPVLLLLPVTIRMTPF